MSIPFPTDIVPFNKFRVELVAEEIDTDDSVYFSFKAPRDFARYMIGLATIMADHNAISGDYDNQIAVVELFMEYVIRMDFCDMMVQCIENNEDVQNAILGAVGSGSGGFPAGGEYGSGAEYPIPSSVNDSNMLDGSGCDNDTLFAIARQFVDFAFDAVQQTYDILEAALNNVELIAALSDNMPVWGQSPFAIALEAALWIQDTASDLFEAYDSETKRNEISCDLFCIMVENDCAFSFDDCWQYFASKTSMSLFDNSISSMLQQITGFSTAETVGTASMAALFGTLAAGSSFGGIRNLNSLFVVIASFFNDTDSDWEILCDECGDELCVLPITETWSGGTQLECTTVVLGTIQAAQGEGGAYALRMSGSGSNNTIAAQARIDVAEEPTSLSADIRFYCTSTSTLQGSLNVVFRNALGTVVSNQTINTNTAGWQGQIVSYDNSPNEIASVQVQIAITSGAGSLTRDMRLGVIEVS